MFSRATRRSWMLALGAALLHGPAGADPLQCQIHVDPFIPAAPAEVHFSALFTGATPTSFHWNFSDGETSIAQSPTHTFTASGIYPVILEVQAGPEACADTVALYLDVIIDPLCGHIAGPTWAVGADPIQFDAYLGLLGDPPPYTWHWTFGDGTFTDVTTSNFFHSIQHAYLVPGTYWAALALETPLGTYPCYDTQRITTLVPQVGGVTPADAEARLRIEPPRPNPFGLATTIAWVLPRAGHVRLRIVDPQGRDVATLVDGARTAGPHAAVWQGRGRSGARVPAGLYFAVLEQDGETRSARVVRLP